MSGCFARIEIPDGKIKEIMDRIDKAQKEIYECYNKLEDLGVVKLVSSTEGEEKTDYELSDEDSSLPGNIDSETTEKILWCFEQDKKTGAVTVVPMNGGKVIIHGRQEAETFCRFLTGCFQ